jgi:hypothetical protein
MTNFFPGTAPFAVLRKPSKAKITRTGILLDMLPPEITCQSGAVIPAPAGILAFCCVPGNILAARFCAHDPFGFSRRSQM